MTKPKGTADLVAGISATMADTIPTVGDTAGEWQALVDALEADDTQSVKAILAANQLPQALAGPLALVRPEARRLQAIVDADVDQSAILAAELEWRLLQQSSPRTTDDAVKIGERLTALAKEIADMHRRQGEAAHARNQLAGLRNIFSELFSGSPGKRSCGGIANVVNNALALAGFDYLDLIDKPWTEAYKLQTDTSTKPRRRLIARS